MSNSFHKTPDMGITGCASEKTDKQLANRIARRSIKQYMALTPYRYTHLDHREFRFKNIYDFVAGGKHYYGNLKTVTAPITKN